MKPSPATTLPFVGALRLLVLVSVSWLWADNESYSATFNAEFVNQTTILVGTVAAPPGPYPSPIIVSNMPGVISDVSVVLTNFTHTVPDDVDILLVSPTGQKLLLMSDAGGDNTASFLRLGFSDAFTAVLPDSTRLISGNYLPSNYGSGDTFPNPAPAAPYDKSFSVFDGFNPNGPWRLFVTDDVVGAGSGSIGGWHLNITTIAAPPVFEIQPQDRIVQPGTDVTFDVRVSGTPPFGYQWMHNGRVFIPFGQGGGPTLKLNNVSSNQAGFYSVIVTNAVNRIGVQSRVARLDVLGRLTVVDPPRSVVTEPGADIELSVGNAGNPPFRYQWTLNGIPLPGETNANLLLRKVLAQSGGNFQVIIWNGDEAVTTDPALVVVRAPTGPSPEDKFGARPTLQSPRGILQGDSTDARREVGEPIRRGGGKTMWFEWFAPESGIVTFTTRGSTFDTFLGVFTGQEVNALTPITSDDDRGGFYTSSFQFNAVRGQSYQIQIDGLGRNGGGGEFTVSWDLEVTQEVVPVIVVEPEPVAVVVGDRAIFQVKMDSEDVQYQWLFNGIPIRGAVENTLVIPSAKSAQVGLYSVRILNRFNRSVLSPPVVLQIGSIGGFLWQDKLEYLLYSFGPGAFRPAGLSALTSIGLGAFMPIGAGDSFFQEVPSAANHQSGDPNPCGNPFFGTLWQGLAATDNGVIQVDTMGSEILARMAVYRITGGADDFFQPAFICDLSSASNGVPALAQFPATGGTNYAIVVEGFEASGNLQLNCQMGVAPTLTNPLLNCFVPEGGGIILQMPATNWNPLPYCQWKLNGIDLPGANSPTLTLSNFSALGVGTYSVYVSNFVSSTTRPVASLSLVGPFTVNHWWDTNAGKIGFVLNSSNSMPFVLETSTNLNGSWTPIATNPDPCTVLLYTNGSPFAVPQRFFRAAPWPPLGP